MKTENTTKYRFAVDIDDVLRCLLCNMVTLYNKEFGTTMTCEDVVDYSVEKSFPMLRKKYGSAAEWFFSKNAEVLFKQSNPIYGSVDAINKLYDYGDVYIVTKQSGILNKIYALEWLEKCGIRYNAVCFVEDKSIIQCDFLIDDYHENFRNMRCRYGVLIEAPYNANVSNEYLEEISKCKKILRFENLSQFVLYFEKNFLDNAKTRN